MLRSARTLAHLRKLRRQVSKLYQLVTIQYVAKITTDQVFTLQTTVIFYGQGQTAICHISEDRLLHHMNVKTEEICGNKLNSKSKKNIFRQFQH
jgi:hypothetical protein